MGSRARMGRLIAIIGGLSILFAGCGDDDTVAIFDCPNCEDWTTLVTGNAKHASYRPGSTDIIAFSSDRETSDNTENIWIAEIGSGGEETVFHQVTDSGINDYDPSWSPDGNRIAFTRATTGGSELYLIRIDDFDNPGTRSGSPTPTSPTPPSSPVPPPLSGSTTRRFSTRTARTSIRSPWRERFHWRSGR